MALYLDTLSRARVAIGICGRCSTKVSIEELEPDPNSPGLRVCKDCKDVLDPWRLPPRMTENITLDYPRPDTPIEPSDQFIVAVGNVVGSFQVGELVIGQQSGAQAQFVSLASSIMTFNETTSAVTFFENEIIVGNTSEATAQVTQQYGES